MKVFLSHCSADKPRIEELATRLITEHGIDVWYDKWEIGAGEDIVAKINEGLQQSVAALVVFSVNTNNPHQGLWAVEERSSLIHQRIQDKKRIIPLVLDDTAEIPELLRHVRHAKLHEIDLIVSGLKGERPWKPALGSAATPAIHRVVISLRESAPGQVAATVQMGETRVVGETRPALPRSIVLALQQFRAGPPRHLLRQTHSPGPAADDAWLVQLGRDLGTLCLPGDAATTLANLLRDRPLGTLCEVIFEADRADWLSLPFEALRLPDGTLLATQPGVATWRRPGPALSVKPTPLVPLAHPLKVLVAVGAPDEDKSKAVVLDHEQELQVILDAVEPVQRNENCELRILEVGHPDEIAKALQDDPYHVLHLSCHGNAGKLLLETELGEEEPVSPQQFVAALQGKKQQIPLVFLNACHSGVASGESAGFAVELLRAGVPAVVATLAPITDRYATQLAGAFYRQLSRTDTARPAEALAAARRDVEEQRKKLLAAGQTHEAGPAEYATTTLYLAGEDRPLVDGHADRVNLTIRSINTLAGELPALQRGDLIGRRHELRTALRVLRAREGLPGVLLRGIGGLGKSALAGRIAMAQLEQHWYLAVHRGEFDLGSVVREVGEALQDSPSARLAQPLLNPQLDDESRLKLLRRLFQTEPVLLVLDDFEQNLTLGGKELQRPEVQRVLEPLLSGTHRGRVLVTCRYGLRGVPGCEGFGELLADVPLRPLSVAEVRKLVQRLPGLRGQDPALLQRVIRGIGGHPRMLEFLNGLLIHTAGNAALAQTGGARLQKIWLQMVALARKEGVDLDLENATLDEQVELALRLGQRDICLGELVQLAREAGDAEVLFQAAVSNLPVTMAEVAAMLSIENPKSIEPKWKRLQRLSLFTTVTDARSVVPRWTAEGLRTFQIDEEYRARCVRAGDFRIWQVKNQSHSLEHGIEAFRNYFSGGEIDRGAAAAVGVVEALDRFQQTVAMVAVANEALQSVPPDHDLFAHLWDLEAQGHLRLGDIRRAKGLYQSLLQQHESRAAAHPDRADYQRILSVSYDRMGDLYRALGDGPAARDAFQQSLDIAQKLAAAEPDRADLQRDLSVSFNKMGDLYSALGDGPAARDAFQKSLAIRQKLAAAEPDRADLQRDLSVSFNNMGDLYRALGDGPAARDAFQKSLAIAQKLAAAEPDRADYQRDLSVSWTRLGQSALADGDLETAGKAFQKDLAIAIQLAKREPDRADYQVDVVSSLMQVARITEDPRQPLGMALQILEQLDQTGRLSPADRPKLEGLRQVMQQLDEASG